MSRHSVFPLAPFSASWLAVVIGCVVTLSLSTSLNAQSPDTAFRVEKVEDPAGWKVYRGEDLVAGYIDDSNGRPVIFPLLSAGGKRMTRNFPFTSGDQTEREDHDHHRSMWLTHGDVNGVDFWIDDEGCGRIVQQDSSASVNDDGAAVLLTHNDWLDAEGNRILSDTRQFTFHVVGERHVVDCDFLLKATDGDVNFGDTKEGSFGLRIAGTMKVDANPGGLITNAEGETNKDAWGKKSAWVDYSGPIDGKPAGITIHDHPSSFGYPCRWHVRTYGLFAANPFGVHHFTGGGETNGIVLTDGKQMRLNYRVVLTDGEFDPEVAASDSEKFANDPRPELN